MNPPDEGDIQLVREALAALDTLSAAQVPEQQCPKCGYNVFYGGNCVLCFTKEHIVKAAPQVPEKCAIGWGEAKHYGPPDSMGICHPIENSTAPQVSGDVDAFIEKLSVIDVKRINNNLTLTEWRTLARAYVAEYRESAISAERAASDRLREALRDTEYFMRQRHYYEAANGETQQLYRNVLAALAAQTKVGK